MAKETYKPTYSKKFHGSGWELSLSVSPSHTNPDQQPLNLSGSDIQHLVHDVKAARDAGAVTIDELVYQVRHWTDEYIHWPETFDDHQQETNLTIQVDLPSIFTNITTFLYIVSARRDYQQRTIDERRLRALVFLIQEKLNQGMSPEKIVRQLLRDEEIGEESEARVQSLIYLIPGVKDVTPTEKWGDSDYVNKQDLIVSFWPATFYHFALQEVYIQVKSSAAGVASFREKLAKCLELSDSELTEYLLRSKLIVLNAHPTVSDSQLHKSFDDQLTAILNRYQS